MKKIKVVNSKRKLIVDDQDYERLSKHKWYFTESKFNREAYITTLVVTGHSPYKRSRVRASHIIMGVTGRKLVVTYRNSNTFDCRRENLIVMPQNTVGFTRRKARGKWASQYKGVSWRRNERMWVASITLNTKKKHLGYFRDEVEAAKKYDDAARELFGDVARLNFPRRRETPECSLLPGETVQRASYEAGLLRGLLYEPEKPFVPKRDKAA